jgi:hypothetical protein
MKKIFAFLFLILCVSKGYSQQDTITPKVEKLIEKWCPMYVLNNYCIKTGLTNIYKKFNVDERVSGFAKAENRREPTQDSMTVVLYNNVSIYFENWQGVEYLHTFFIYFKKKEDMEKFSLCYKYLMGYVKDEDNPTRFYHQGAPMNAVIQYSVPEKKYYYVIITYY